MPVDIETEVVQLWAASRVVADTMKSKLPRQPDGLTIPQSGLRSGRDQQLAGLSQILELTRSFTLELAIKALFRRINPKSNPENTHDLQKLFNSLPKDVKNRLNPNPPKRWSLALTQGLMGKGGRTGQARSQQMGLRVARGGHASGKIAAHSGGGGRNRPGGRPEVTLADWTGTSVRESPWVVR